jgi:hypothetical protein
MRVARADVDVDKVDGVESTGYDELAGEKDEGREKAGITDGEKNEDADEDEDDDDGVEQEKEEDMVGEVKEKGDESADDEA